MRALWIVPERGRLAACGLAVMCLLGCGGEEFAGGGASGAGGSSGSGKGGGSQGGTDLGGGDSGGDAGDTASAGSASLGGNAGAGGTTPVGCNCAAGKYCRDGSTDCFDCTELSRLRFRSPERLATLSDGTGSRFPRVGGTGTDLLYQFDSVGLRYTTDSSTSAGSSVALTTPQDSAPLLLSADVTTLPGTMLDGFNFVFDRVVEGDSRALYFGQWDDGLQKAEPMPAPYNAEGTSNFGLAIALQGAAAPRGYWMTNRVQGMPLALVSALFTANAPGDIVQLNIGSAGCLPDQSDLTPWITPDGKTLLFSHTRVDGSCASTGQGKDIYTALMVPATGQVLPTGMGPTPSQPLADVNSSQDDVDPSFSADFCDLYFSSNRDGDFALYRAHRR
jgi:hypothetical protein